MKIAWVSFEFREYSVLQANALSDEHQVLLILPDNNLFDSELQVRSEIDHFRFWQPRLRQPVRQLRSILEIVRRIHEFQPDVIHFQGGHLWFNCALPLLRRYPLVITVHDPRRHEGDTESRKTPQWIMDFGYRRADHVIVHGKSLVDVTHEAIGIPRNRIHVIPHVAPVTFPRIKDIDEDEFGVLFFGRIWGYKGLEYLIRAEPLISSRVPDVMITIAGSGEKFNRYRRMMVHPERFFVDNGWISYEQRAVYFQKCAFVVLPYISATQSGVVSTAFNYGKPVIVTSVGALPDAVEHGRTGLIVPPCEEQALADAIVDLLLDAPRRREMGLEARTRLQRECAPQTIAQSNLEVYGQAIRDHRAKR